MQNARRRRRKGQIKKKKKGRRKWKPYDQWKREQDEKKKYVNLCSDDDDDEEEPEFKSEYQLQKGYHRWYKYNWPYSVSSSCPYTHDFSKSKMKIIQRAKEKCKGYQTGYPDYVQHDPRLFIEEDDDNLYLRIVPAQFYEFKHPNGNARLRPCQTKVLKALKRRGHDVHKIDDFDEAKRLTNQHRKGIPIYNGDIVINKRTLNFKFPKPPPKIKLPTKLSTASTTKNSKKKKTKKRKRITKKKTRKRRKKN